MYGPLLISAQQKNTIFVRFCRYIILNYRSQKKMPLKTLFTNEWRRSYVYIYNTAFKDKLTMIDNKIFKTLVTR